MIMINPSYPHARRLLELLRSCSGTLRRDDNQLDIFLAISDRLEQVGICSEDPSLDHLQPVSLRPGLVVAPLLTQLRAVEQELPLAETHKADRSTH